MEFEYVYQLFKELKNYEKTLYKNSVHWSKKKQMIIKKFYELLEQLEKSKKENAISRFERDYYKLK